MNTDESKQENIVQYEEQHNINYFETKNLDKITFRINLVRLWQVFTIVSVIFNIIFCSLWLDASKGDKEALKNELQLFVFKSDILFPGASEAPKEESVKDLNVSGVSIAGKKIIIDPGHGGDVPGGTTGVSGKREKDVNLEISLKLKKLLENEGATVIMTRETDTALGDTWEKDMQARENIILKSNADMFLSIHQNEFEDSSATGPQVFFVKQGSEGKRLAVCVQDMLNSELGIETPRIALEAAYRVLKPGSQPSCTIECGFMSNPEEDLKLQDENYQNKIVQAITDGIKLYVKQFG